MDLENKNRAEDSNNAGNVPAASTSNEPSNKPADSELQEFDSLIDSYLDRVVQHEVDSVISVSVVAVHRDHVLVDLGDKAEGVIPIQEFFDAKGNVRIAAGDKIDVVVLGREEESGLVEVSYKRARAQNAWSRLEQAQAGQVPISGRVTRAVKSGLLVDVGAECFMPASQISDQRVANLEEWVDKDIEALVIELDKTKRRAILSRRRIVEQQKREALEQALTKVKEGETVQGTVKAILNFGAFLDIAGLDAYLPREELSWDRGVAPTSLLQVGAHVKVKIQHVDHETGRIRVSRKALRLDPWQAAPTKYPENSQVVGEVVSVTRFGAFVRIEEGLTGLIHLSDMSWGKAPSRPTDFVKEGDTVRAVVLGVDVEKQRLSLGLKQMVEDPWLEAEKRFPRGSIVKGVVMNLAPFGAFVKLTGLAEKRGRGRKHEGDLGSGIADCGLKESTAGDQAPQPEAGGTEASETATAGAASHSALSTQHSALSSQHSFDVEGLIHISDLSWEEKVKHPGEVLKAGQEIEAKVLKTDRTTRRISLGLKQLTPSPTDRWLKDHPAGSVVEGEIVRMMPTGVFVSLAPGLDGFLHVSQMDRERVEKPESLFKVGDTVQCKVTKVERGKVSLSRKMLIEAEESKAIKMYKADPKDKGGVNLGELLSGLQITGKDASDETE
jgi:small subunit ribosomal protein S1